MYIKLNNYLLSVHPTAFFDVAKLTQTSQRVLNARVGLFDCCALCHEQI